MKSKTFRDAMKDLLEVTTIAQFYDVMNAFKLLLDSAFINVQEYAALNTVASILFPGIYLEWATEADINV